MASNTWADGPWALLEMPSKTQDVTSHPAIWIANEMTHAHNCMLRGLNAMYLQAPHVRATKDVADLRAFARIWTNWIIHHHTMEEEIMFPEFESVLGQPGALTRNVEQHHAFQPALERVLGFADGGDAGSSSSDTAALCATLEELGPGFREHLADEIATLLAMRELCAGDEAKGEELRRIWAKCESEATTQSKFAVPPMVMGLRDKTYEGGNNWPIIPGGVATEYVIANLLSLPNRGAWRFLPCDHYGQPRKLAFTAEASS